MAAANELGVAISRPVDVQALEEADINQVFATSWPSPLAGRRPSVLPAKSRSV
ncbi:MAG: hypothetical protein WBY94_10375 [Polyangiaceae bacterium]